MAGRRIHFFAAYYVANAAVVLSYLAWRSALSTSELTKPAQYLGAFLTKESEIVIVMVLLLLSRIRRAASWEEVLRKGLTLGKFMVLSLTYLLDRRVFALTLVLSAATALVPLPSYDDDEALVLMDEAEFRATVRGAGAAGDGRSWLVCFHAPWCSDAQLFRPIFSQLCASFGQEGGRVTFALVDIVAHPAVAKDLNIDDGGMSKQLPTVVLFHRGREVRRLPAFKSDGGVVAGKIGYADAASYFELAEERPTYLRRAKGAARTGGKKDK